MLIFLVINLYCPSLLPSLFSFCLHRLLFLFLQAKYNRDGHSYCSSQGCERIKIVTKDSAKGVSNCMAKAYPKYYQGPAVIKQMPVKTTVPCTKCGTTQVKENRQKLLSSVQSVLYTTRVKGIVSVFFSTETAPANLRYSLFIFCAQEGREALGA